MPRKKKIQSVKEPVKLRFKELADGSQSIYLDIYKDGKRSYEFLKLYLVPGNSTLVKSQNEAVLAAANTIKSQRIIELANNQAGLKNTRIHSKIKLLDWMKTYHDNQEKKGVKGSHHLIMNTIHVLSAYNKNAMMRDVDKDFILGFIDFLRNDYKTQQGKAIATYTAISYLGCFRGALNAAVSADIIPENPLNKLTPQEKFKAPESKREYLTIDELKTLIEHPCEREDIKQAYIFACYCGLRISDIQSLKWSDLTLDGEQWRVAIVMQKTQAPLYLPLSKQALQWMPQRGVAKDDDRVFPTLPEEYAINKVLKKWTKEAGINKLITFHTSRHTFATMLITLGADLYVVSKLLGHANIKTTEIYAKIVNKKKDDAIALIDKEFIDTM